jgi:hypothetical protein
MRCEDFEARLNEVLDERRPLSSAAELEEHSRQCSGCRELVRSYEAMLVGLTYENVPAVPAWLTARIVKEAAPALDRSSAKIVRFPPRIAALALAAAVLLMAVGWTWMTNARRPAIDDGQNSGSEIIAHAVPGRRTKQPQPPAPIAVPVKPVKEVASSNRPSHETKPGSSILPNGEWVQPGAEWAQEVADGLQPVTRPTVGAISGFLNLWGIGQQGRRS